MSALSSSASQTPSAKEKEKTSIRLEKSEKGGGRLALSPRTPSERAYSTYSALECPVRFHSPLHLAVTPGLCPQFLASTRPSPDRQIYFNSEPADDRSLCNTACVCLSFTASCSCVLALSCSQKWTQS